MYYRFYRIVQLALVCLVFLGAVAHAQRSRGRRAPDLARINAARAVNPNPSALRVARLHYSGGGDWYWGASALPNFLGYLRENTGLSA
jgi:hypothetical protein